MDCADLWAELKTLFRFWKGMMPWTGAKPQVWAGPLALVLEPVHHQLAQQGIEIGKEHTIWPLSGLYTPTLGTLSAHAMCL